MTDYVFTYVDAEDDNWYKTFKEASSKAGRSTSRTNVRFRSWGTLKYLLRGIAEYLPFINNLYMVVSDISQVPDWVNQDTVHIVLHKDIIPEKYRPTYNSNTIETFLYKIPGLSEQFIYGNDDMFPIGPMKEDDFYKDGMPLISCKIKDKPNNMTLYRKSLVRTLELCKKFNKYRLDSKQYVRSDHSLSPMLKSTWKAYHDKYGKDICSTISAFRKSDNVTQELSNFHHFIYNQKNKIRVFKKRKVTYFEFRNMAATRLERYMGNKSTQIICINDAGVQDYNKDKDIVCNIFEKKFPNKCKYEK